MPSLTGNVRLVVWRALFISFPFIHLEFLPKVSCLDTLYIIYPTQGVPVLQMLKGYGKVDSHLDRL